MTNRIQRLKNALFANPREISLERALLYTTSYQQTEGEPVIMRRAKSTAYILDHGASVAGMSQCGGHGGQRVALSGYGLPHHPSAKD